MRAILIAVIGVCAVLGAVVYLVLSLDAIVARAIEREGTRIVGAPVHVSSVELDLPEGTGTIRSLRVSNPEGFEGDDAVELDEIELVLDVESVHERPLRIAEVRIEDSTVNLEVDETGRSNMEWLLAHARGKPGRSRGSGESRGDDSGEPVRITIDRLDFAGGTVVFDRPGPTEPDRFELPGFEKVGIGGTDGATGGEIAKTFTLALARHVAASAVGREVQRAVDEELGSAVGAAAGSLVEDLLGE